MLMNFFRFLGVNLCISYIFYKIINDVKVNIYKKLFILFISTTLAFFESWAKNYISIMYVVAITYIIYSMIIAKLSNNNIGYCLIVMLICVSLSFVLHFVSSILVALILLLINCDYNNEFIVVSLIVIEPILINRIFKINRFKNGFPFIKSKRKDDCLNIFILVICANMIFIYFIILNYADISFKKLSVLLIFFMIIMIITLYKTFLIYQKQKLLEKTIKDYEKELEESKTELESVIKQKDNLVKANHEFYHRQEALNLKLDNLMKNKKALFKEEYGSIIERVNTLSNEYSKSIGSTQTSYSIPKTNVPEIDDMFVYMQSECNKNNIEFTVRLTCDVYQLINNIIPKSKFETLIGDLIRNAIIAINYSSNKHKSIMVILGIKDNIYEFSVYDTGIEFEKHTLLKLGLEKATTHSDNGGTGIGFITTFETLNYCNASLIITEYNNKDFEYSKSITIRFDNKKQYIIDTYRANEFDLTRCDRKDIILKSIDIHSYN